MLTFVKANDTNSRTMVNLFLTLTTFSRLIWSKKWLDVSISFPHEHRRPRQSWKLCLRLCSQRWLKPRRNLVISLIAFGLWQLWMLFGLDRMNFKILLLEKSTLSELRMSGSRVFHSFIVEEIKELVKNWYFVRTW